MYTWVSDKGFMDPRGPMHRLQEAHEPPKPHSGGERACSFCQILTEFRTYTAPETSQLKVRRGELAGWRSHREAL